MHRRLAPSMLALSLLLCGDSLATDPPSSIGPISSFALLPELDAAEYYSSDTDLSVGPEGTLYVAANPRGGGGRSLWRVAPDGSRALLTSSLPGERIAAGPDGNVYAIGVDSSSGVGHAVVSKTDSSGRSSVFAGFPEWDPDPYDFAGMSIAVAPSGEIYVAGEHSTTDGVTFTTTRRIWRLSADGARTLIAGVPWVSNDEGQPPPPPIIDGALAVESRCPRGRIAAGPAGELFVLEFEFEAGSEDPMTPNFVHVWRIAADGTIRSFVQFSELNVYSGAEFCADALGGLLVAGGIGEYIDDEHYSSGHFIWRVGADGARTLVAGTSAILDDTNPPPPVVDGTPAQDAWLPGHTIAAGPSGEIFLFGDDRSSGVARAKVWRIGCPVSLFDASVYPKQLRRVIGCCADGASAVIVEIARPPGETIPTQPSEGDGTITSAAEGRPGFVAFRYRPPASFARSDHPEDLSVARRDVTLTFNVDGAVCRATLPLARPPVLMLHGLWSNGSTWNSLRDALLTIGYPRSWAFATSYPNSIRVARQQPGFSARITATLNGPLRDGFVATEIDIVAHSMGGLIAKRFGAQESGRIRSIVTVGTPHLGSPGADLLVALQADLLRAHPKLSWPLTWLFQLTNDKGAVADLRENGGVHVGWSVPNVSTTMIVGVANAQNIVGPPQVGLDDVFFDLSLVFPRTYAKRFPGKDLSTKKLLHDAVFKGRRSDWLVSEPSQAGGATDFEVVDTPVDTMEHTTETNNAEVLSKILLALGTSTTKRLRATTPRRATPRNRNPSGEDSALRKRSGAVESASIDIESPVEGASYAPGDSVHVAVNVTGAPDVVAIATNGDDFEILEAGPYDRTFTIPDDFVGSYTVLVIARNADDRFATAERTVNVTTSATLQTLRVAPDSDPTYLSPGVVVPLDVQGDFSDGVTRNVTAAVTGTTYESSDPTVVTVSADGELTSVGYGAATVTVANSGVTALIHVKSPIDLLTARGTIGSAVHFFGAGFGSRKGSVRVGGRAAKVRRWSDAGVTCVVSSAATVGPADVALRLASKGPGQTVPFPGAFEFVAPTATTFTGAVAPGATLTVAGTYFGTQRGTAALVAEGKPRVALRVKSWTMDADSGASQAVVVLPRNVASGDWQLVLTNRLGPTGVSVTVP